MLNSSCITPRLNRAFFERETVIVARDLLGRMLVHDIDGQRVAGRIVETEAYTGWADSASHAHRGETARNQVMFGLAGISYIYLIYGNYWLLNVIAKPHGADYPAAVLIRALEPVEGLEIMATHRPGRPIRKWTNGPGRLTLALGIDQLLNHQDMVDPHSALYFETGASVPDGEVQTSPRVGLGKAVAEPWRSQPWRFTIGGSPYVSK